MGSQWKWLATCCLGLAAMTAGAGEAAKVDIDFAVEDAAAWAKTKGATVAMADGAVVIDGTDWDSKIYKSVALAPDTRYRLEATARGQALIRLHVNWEKAFVELRLGGKDFVTSHREFTTPPGGRYTLALQVDAQQGRCEVKNLSIAPVDPAAVAPVVGTPHWRPAATPPAAPAPADLPPTPRLRGFTMPNNPAALKDARGFGANVVRFHTGPTVSQLKPNTTTIAPDGSFVWDLSHIWVFLDEAERQGLAVVIDLQYPRNPNEAKYRKDRRGRSADFWNDESNLRLMHQFWTEVAEHCKDRKQTIWYDLLNEPLNWEDFPSHPKKWPEWAQILIDAIRAIDPVHEIVVEPGPGGLCWAFKDFPLLKGERIVYSAHNYQPHAYTHQGISDLANTDLAKAYLEREQRWPGVYGDAGGGLWDAKRLEERELQPVIEFQRKHGARIYIGEFSAVRWAPDAAAYLRDNLELFEKYGWDWTYHAFREYNGWSFEYDDAYPAGGKAEPAKETTERAKVLLEYLKRNGAPAQ